MKSRSRRWVQYYDVSAEIGSFVESLETRIVLASTQMLVDVLVPPKFREGNAFAITAMEGIPGQVVKVQVVGDNNAIQYQFPVTQIDENGNTTLALRMPYVLTRGFTVDGRTLRVSTDTYTNDFRVTLNRGQRVSLSTDNVREGQSMTVTLKNGAAKSQVIIQIIRDNTEIVHGWDGVKTDSSGNGTYSVNIPAVLSRGQQVDNYGLRVISGGMVFDQKVTITAGVQVEIGAKSVREKSSVFPMNVHNAKPNAAVVVKWYLGTSQRGISKTFHVGRNGEGSFQVTTPSKLITNSAIYDVFRFKVSVSGQSTAVRFPMFVYKYTQPSPDSGESQFLTFAPLAIKWNAAPGVAFHTPAALGVKSFVPISRAENLDLGQKDPAMTIQNWMSHQLVLLCYGSGQRPGDNAGMDLAYQKMQGITGQSHVLRLFSGDNSVAPVQAALNAYEATLAAQRLIIENMERLANLRETIKSVVIVGYSWGGGMAKKLATWIAKTYQIEISGLMYVDAVRHGSIGRETNLPNPKPSSFVNVYQSLSWDFLVDSVALGNGHIPNYDLPVFDGEHIYGRYLEINTDAGGINRTNHTSIDDWAANGIAEFVNGVLNEWYGAHPS